jgi:hypothetical protein
MLYLCGSIEKSMVSVMRCFKMMEIPQEEEDSQLKLPVGEKFM